VPVVVVLPIASLLLLLFAVYRISLLVLAFSPISGV
jgi:hypothetical protein